MGSVAVGLALIAVPGRAVATARGSSALSPAVPLSYFQDEPLRIGQRVQLLVDDHVIEDRWKLTRRNGRIVKHLGNPLIVQDKPWEDHVGPACVLYDDSVQKYRMWYKCFNLTNYFSHEGPSYYTAYAESEDGFNWIKPALAGFPFGGHERTNVVFTGFKGKRASAMDVSIDPAPSDPARCYMATSLSAGGRVDLSYSPDGLHWTITGEPLINYHSDFPNQMLWIPEWQLWVMYVRPSTELCATGTKRLPEGTRHPRRRLAFTTSKDRIRWSTPRIIMYPDERGQPDYDSALIFRRHGVFICLYTEMYQEEGGSETETHLATSRDGIHWQRTWDREPFIARGPEGAWDHGQVSPSISPPLEMGQNLVFYYYGSPFGQSVWGREGAIGLCRMRQDRFIGHWAGEDTGYLLTRQFVLEGSTLRVNCSSVPIPYYDESHGIYAEILGAVDAEGNATDAIKPIPGFTFEDCDKIKADQLDKIVTWKKKSDLSVLNGKAVFIRFKLKHAGLFAFRIGK
jgi:hypothetical protein